MNFSTSTLLTLALVLLVQLQSAAAQVCHICGESGNDLMQYPQVVLANEGRTCNDISIDVAINNVFGSGGCTAAQNTFRARCCTPGQRPSGIDQALGGLPPQNIPNIPHTGPHPVCNVCRDGDFPYDTSMVLNFLYMGVGDCVQYYILGKRGAIEAHMCAPVQFFSYEPCGCGEFNPYFNPNHPLALAAAQAPDTGSTTSGAVNGRTNGSSNGSTNGSTTTTTTTSTSKTPDADADKTGQKMGGSYGGAGGINHGGRRRGLKGAASKTVKVLEDVVVNIEV